MKEHPILFKTEMVQAILNGHKSQTRRIITPQNSIVGEGKVDWNDFCWDGTEVYKDTCQHGHTEIHKAPLPFADGIKLHVPYKYSEDCTIYRIYPKWDIGDRLWVKETFLIATDNSIIYRADNNMERHEGIWRPSIFMPRWASRITLEITDIRVQRIQDITEEDAIAEGAQAGYILASPTIFHKGLPGYTETPKDYRMGYMRLWDSINLKRGYGWDNNPYVWVISFKVIK